MEAPIEDAVTVAYVGMIHAVGELKSLYWTSSDDVWEEIQQVLEELENALTMLQPHVNGGRVV